MPEKRSHKGLREFLDASGVLESGDDELIKKARAAYWRKYSRDYKREQRAKFHEHTLALNKKENALIEREAVRHGMTASLFMRQAVLAYVQKHYLPFANEVLIVIERHLSHIRTQVESHSGSDDGANQAAALALDSLEKALLRNAQSPPCLDDLIRTALEERPHYLLTIKQLIQEYDH
jgi:hypothetical protein